MIARQSLPVILVAMISGLVAGATASSFREARAETNAETTSIVVGKAGLVFKSADGKAMARLSRDPNGNKFELYDSTGQTKLLFVASSVEGGMIAADDRPNAVAKKPDQQPAPQRPRVDFGY